MKIIIPSILIIFLFLPSQHGFAQQQLIDTSGWEEIMQTIADETVITATRNDRSLSSVTVPATVIQGNLIRKQGMVTLSQVLQEQSGVLVTAANGSNAVGGGVFGNGVQIQGLSPDYTLIMLDGEPIIGRQGGVLDLTRFAVGNIRKVEIVKGPSSSLYGSEALGGVINILTDQSRQDQMRVSARYGSFNTWDLFGLAQKEYKKSSFQGFFHYNASNGYDLTPETPTKTIDPHRDYTGQFRWIHRFSEKTRLTWNNRYFKGIQFSDFSIANANLKIQGDGITKDWNINPVLEHRWSDKIKSELRLYGTGYRYVQSLSEESGKPYYQDDFTQQFYRAEQQNHWQTNQKLSFIFGGGYVRQTVETMRYRTKKYQDISYIFLQTEYHPTEKLTLIPGLRYDHNSAYASRVSPKVSFLYTLGERHSILGSYGSGFKAPDFRQLYLSYANPAAQGYRVFGVEEFSVASLEEEKSNGTVQSILPEAYLISDLSPEYSHGVNLGYRGHSKSKLWSWDVNVFYNDIRNLINYLPVAIQENGSFIYSYRNTQRAFTSGLESNVQGKAGKAWEWSAGYQFLYTGEQQKLNEIRKGNMYGRISPDGPVRQMGFNDYSGLLGRSPHMANLKLSYAFPRGETSANVRVIYRSKWGVADLDGNGFANMSEEFAQGFTTVNLSIQKTFFSMCTVQLHANNLLNHRDEVSLPNMPGFNLAGNIICNF